MNSVVSNQEILSTDDIAGGQHLYGASVPTPTPAPTATPGPSGTHLANISTRMKVGTGQNVLIGGFIIQGTESKTIIVRAMGPVSLTSASRMSWPILSWSCTIRPAASSLRTTIGRMAGSRPRFGRQVLLQPIQRSPRSSSLFPRAITPLWSVDGAAARGQGWSKFTKWIRAAREW